jgi:hypothetical protein
MDIVQNLSFNLKLYIKSGSQIDGHITFESAVVWCLREMGCEVVGCARRRALYWELHWLISSLTVVSWRSCLRFPFGTYQGASVIMRKTFDWNRSRISMFELEAVPQSSRESNFRYYLCRGHAVVQLLETLFYKPEVHGFDSQ